MLNRYYDLAYHDADDEERRLFLQLLELQDPVLLPYLMGSKIPAQKGLSELVKKIRSISPHNT